MKLKALDQHHLSDVKADSLRPGEEFEVSDARGEELMKAHPRVFQRVGGAKAAPAPETAVAEAPANKSEAAPANKATLSAETVPAKRGRKPKR